MGPPQGDIWEMGKLAKWSQRVNQNLLALWKGLVGDHLICQIELFAIVLVRWEFQKELANKRVLLFVDNNSARGGILKGRSNSPTMDDLVTAFYMPPKSMCDPSGGWKGFPVRATLLTNHPDS